MSELTCVTVIGDCMYSGAQGFDYLEGSGGSVQPRLPLRMSGR